MPDILSRWFLRRKIDAQVRLSGRPMEHSRVVNPYHAVSIASGSQCCEEARHLGDQRFLASAAPKLPLRGCTIDTCQCHYDHYNDRRNTRDRRVQPHNPNRHKMGERRSSGRRNTD